MDTQGQHSDGLKVSEIFFSIQGESTHSGRPCAFVRLTGCPLRCVWCDTAYAFSGGKQMSIEEILAKLKGFSTKLVQLTGGEPLAQAQSHQLLAAIVDAGYETLVETSGAYPIENLPEDVKVIMDVKCPASGESHRNLWDNIGWLRAGKDEVKFVIADKKDFEFMLEVDTNYNLSQKLTVLASPVYGQLALKDLAAWILESGRAFRLQSQLHKDVWGADTIGV